jgi:hypothetical protein
LDKGEFMVFILELSNKNSAAKSLIRHWARKQKLLRENRRRVRSMTAGEAEQLRRSTIYETSADEARKNFARLQAKARGEAYVD